MFGYGDKRQVAHKRLRKIQDMLLDRGNLLLW